MKKKPIPLTPEQEFIAMLTAKKAALVKLHGMYKTCTKGWEIVQGNRIIQSFMCYQDNKKDFEMIEIQIVKKMGETVVLFSKTEPFDDLAIPDPQTLQKQL